jgi:predicted metal-binding membrane protein
MANERQLRSASPDRAASIAWADRAILWISLAAITLIAWLYLLWMPMGPSDLGAFGRRLLVAAPPALADAALTFLMWAVMMVAMMLPSAAPMIETYATILRSRAASPWPRTALFTAGYLVVWTLFSAAATAGQLLLQKAGIVNNALTTVPIVTAFLLILAGIYQVTPIKHSCLTGCRSPVGFFMHDWCDGASGALRMGLRHGAMCLGCCWMLMVLLFVFGVMNLLWIAALSAFVLLEKLVPGGRLLARGSGIAMIAAGLTLLF